MFAIPSGRLSLCDALAQLTTATWLELGAGIESGQRLAEESVTDFNLMRLAAAVPEIFVEKHTKSEEAISGADWEWWVGRPRSYIGFRVQAKILDPATSRFESLYRTKATATDQANDLIVSALTGQWPTYPLYAFYSHRLPVGTGPTVSPCRYANRDAAAHGWVVASALRVADVLRSAPTKAASAFDQFCYPVPCLFCCPSTCSQVTGADVSLAATLGRRVNHLWLNDGPVRLPRLIHEIAPVYVERMYKGERPESGWAEQGRSAPEARYIPDDLSRVVLVRERLA